MEINIIIFSFICFTFISIIYILNIQSYQNSHLSYTSSACLFFLSLDANSYALILRDIENYSGMRRRTMFISILTSKSSNLVSLTFQILRLNTKLWYLHEDTDIFLLGMACSLLILLQVALIKV